MKIAVTGDGGMMYFQDLEMSRRFERLISHGVWPPSGFAGRSRDRWWEFDLSCFGRRATMNDINSAIGLVQLKKLPKFLHRRAEVHSYYDRELADLDWLRLPPKSPSHVQSSYYLYWIQTESGRRDRLAAFLKNRDVYTTFRYYPLHWIKRYDAGDSLTRAEKAAQRTLCIPNHQSLTANDLTKIVESIVEFGKTV
jgi:aminotransferase